MPDRETGRVTVEGLTATANELGLSIVDSPIQPGDLYLAGRNTGVHLLTCKSVQMRSCGCCADWINPVENAYPYDVWECRKVVMRAVAAGAAA